MSLKYMKVPLVIHPHFLSPFLLDTEIQPGAFLVVEDRSLVLAAVAEEGIALQLLGNQKTGRWLIE